MNCTSSRIHTLIHLDVDGAPPDVVLAGLLKDDTLIFGATASLFSGKVDEGSRRRDDGSFVADSIFVKLGGWGVAFEMNSVHLKAGLREILEILANHWEE